MQFETFASLTALQFITHGFTHRTTADTKSGNYPTQCLQQLGYEEAALVEQPHGDGVAVANAPGFFLKADALVTHQPGLPLVIRCADCAAVFVVDRKQQVIALIHSGKQGTLLNITGTTLATMQHQFDTQPRDCLALISPSIGPCHYEIDIWTGIESQLRGAGVGEIHNPRICTACHRDRYFSYRAEKGNTGRMLAILALS